ncbi:hypothetical protein RJ639_035436, partial [Escallonia herrerae]
YQHSPLPNDFDHPIHDTGDDYRTFGSKFPSLIKSEADIHVFESLAHVGVPQVAAPTASPKMVNVDDFGARGDGTDDTEAFKKAWKEACSSRAVLVVPANKVYHVKPINLSGPCNPDFKMTIHGTIKASINPSDYKKDPRHWLVFEDVHSLAVDGGGTIDGNGRVWWQKSCKINEHLPCRGAPTAVTFDRCNRLRVGSLRIKDAQQMHLTFRDCVDVVASHLMVIAPKESPNTDGIHVSGTQNVKIMNSVIRTGFSSWKAMKSGDDCVSIVNGSRNVQVTDIICGPGHGISIGSLGKDGTKNYVSNVIVDRAKLSGTTNGVRIKSWQGGSGLAENITFQNIEMHNVSNPLIINQNYCDQKKACPTRHSAVQVKNVHYRNIKGTSASEVAINFNCSSNFPCKGINLQDINLVRDGGGDVEASCKNVLQTTRGRVSPHCF